MAKACGKSISSGKISCTSGSSKRRYCLAKPYVQLKTRYTEVPIEFCHWYSPYGCKYETLEKKTNSDLCKLCKCRQTTNHVLSSCKHSLNTGRYTWRHNCIIHYIVNSVDPKYTVHTDLPGHTVSGGGSIPPEVCVTSQKPDIVIVDNNNKTIQLFELTCPSEENIDTRHLEKSNKYHHFSTDITELKCKVHCFEVSTKGFISKRNHTTLKALHSFMRREIKLSTFKSNILALSLMASHFLFICGNDPAFTEPPFLLPLNK